MQPFNDFSKSAGSYRTLPLTESFYTDVLTPVHMFNALKDDALYILESQDPASEWSNYSFIGLDPFIDISETPDGFLMTDLDTDKTFSFNTLKEALDYAENYVDAYTESINLPFKGGAVGYVNYEAVQDLAGIKARSSTNSGNYHFVFTRTLIAYEHRAQKTSIVSFDSPERFESVKDTYNTLKTRIHSLKKRLRDSAHLEDLMLSRRQAENPKLTFTSNYKEADFKRDVDVIKEYISHGEIEQTVLSQRFDTETQCSGFELYRVLRNVNPSPYMFYLNFSDAELIGSSPERQLQVKDRTLEIHPIAGTRRRGNTPAEDAAIAEELLNDEKEVAEHEMLVELALDEFRKVSTEGSVEVSRYMTIGRFAEVMHIISIVNGTLREDVSPIEAFFNSFPAGTLTGAPKTRAMEIIRELEPDNRGLYGGCILYYGFDGNMDSCITIRTMILKDSTVSVQAGAGVVADSTPENEYQETINKASALFNAVNLAEEVFHS
ncbi:Anthranilate synthase component 1 [Jeotgalicoccus saudimassiliensis]|uniref:Anthranilate synthase component 1 n=1 Tax=Jeotgalicoccus saudimassiliensis TaxID=1461582 RepID=A0A078M933_9STAP|nr:chorismate-binding protein [Jeotgalicoccus saudimassiliensis]CEA02760.1 Anthranilate synthase component 1 [Jeotgalicoccus saudimassiliensis]